MGRRQPRVFIAWLHEERRRTASGQELVEQLGAQVERYLRLHGEGFDREREAGVEHRAILAAAVAGDVAAASTHLRSHIDSTRRRVVATITATALQNEVT